MRKVADSGGTPSPGLTVGAPAPVDGTVWAGGSVPAAVEDREAEVTETMGEE